MKWELYNALIALLELAKIEAPPGDVRDWVMRMKLELNDLLENPNYEPGWWK